MAHSETDITSAARQEFVDPRLYMAAERTFLAWIRTGIALMAFGFVIARIEVAQSSLSSFAGGSPASPTLSLLLGISLAVTGIVVLLVSVWRHRRYIEALTANRFREVNGAGFAMGLAGVLASLGILLILYLILH